MLEEANAQGGGVGGRNEGRAAPATEDRSSMMESSSWTDIIVIESVEAFSGSQL